MKKDLWNARHTCTDCNAVIRKKILAIEGMKIRGWECSKCKETVLHPEKAQRILLLNKLKEKILKLK